MRPDVAESAVWEVEFDFDDDNKPAELDVELLFDIPKEHLIEAFDFDVAAAAASNAAAESFCCLLYTSPSPRDRTRSRMPSSA